MSSNESNNKILNKVYHDPAGFGSITSTFKEAFKQVVAATTRRPNH